MQIKETLLKPADKTGSGQVRRFVLPDNKIAVTQITTYNPSVLSPGPAHVYLIEGEALLLVDTGLPTHIARIFSYTWQDKPVPDDIARLPEDFSFQQIVQGIQVAGYAIEDVAGLIISHGHPDHFFNGRAIQKTSGAKVSAHILDAP
jgi:glyoxylase-like metal-dependent hydrolase (beta-lactamase superfamily II)